MSVYLDALKEDYELLRLPAERINPRPYNQWNWERCVSGVAPTCDVTPHTEEEEPLPGNIRTPIARRIVDLMTNGTCPAFLSSFHAVCHEAEPKLLQNIKRESVENKNYKSPVLVTDESQIIGVIKSYGEDTCYGLVDAPKWNIYRGVLHSPMIDFDDLELDLHADHAWLVEASELQAMRPVRLAGFELPLSVRKQFISNTDSEAERAALVTTHTDIKEQIRDLAIDSYYLPLRDQAEALVA